MNTDFSNVDFTNDDELKVLAQVFRKADRDALISVLKGSLAEDLPTALSGQIMAIDDRGRAFDKILELNDRISEGEPMQAERLRGRVVKPRPWLLYPFLPAREVSLCTGEGGIGKSCLFLQIAALLATGYSDGELTVEETWPMSPEHFFLRTDIKKVRTGAVQRIIYAAYEDDIDEVHRRLRTVFDNFEWAWLQRDTILDNLLPVSMRRHGPIWGPEHGKHFQTRSGPLEAAHQLQRLCEREDAKLLMIDPLSAAFCGDENSKAEAYSFVNFWADWADRTGTTVLLSAHLPKNREARRSGYSGTTAWQGAVRSLFTLDKFDMNENEEGERGKKGGKNKDRQWYIALKGIKGNYSNLAREEVPLIRGRFGWLEHTGQTDFRLAQEKAHEAYEAQLPGNEQGVTDEQDDDHLFE